MLAISLVGPLQDVWLPCSATATATPTMPPWCRTCLAPSLATRHRHGCSLVRIPYGVRPYFGGARVTARGPMSHGLCRWAPRSLLALPQLKKASDGQDSAGFGRARQGLSLGWAGQRCPAEWLLGEANDNVGFAGALWLALTCSPETSFSTIPALAQSAWSRGPAGPWRDDHWPASAPVPTCMRMLAAMPWSLSFRTALACAGGNAAIAAETWTRAATRMRFQSCDF